MAKVFVATVAAAEAATLAVTYSDCGDASTHAKVTDLQPTTIETGSTTTLVGTGDLDETINGATFTIDIKANGVQLKTCSGDASGDVACDLPLNVGSLTLKALTFPVNAGTTSISVDTKLSSLIPASLAKTTSHITAVSDTGDKVICLDVNTAKQSKEYAKGFKRMARNFEVEVAEITDEMRAAAPASLDWSTQGATTPVKDQGQCGSCWAYSATQGVESGLFMTSGKETLMALSEQQVISCDKTDGGCDGGDLPTAFSYVKSAGLDTQKDYPDTSNKKGKNGKCKSHKNEVTLLTSKYAVSPCDGGSCSNQDEDGLKAALATHGPLSVCVNAESWNGYYGGILSGSCSGAYNTLDHCVQLVGYDTTGSKSYWKVKNSWAADWGEDGFIRLPMGENSCGIADEAMFTTAQVTGQDVVV